jgi:steroid 5-alpha reductase family enzyme
MKPSHVSLKKSFLYEQEKLMGNAMLVAAITIVVIMVSTWIVSVLVKNASIVDIVWGAGFAITSWVLALTVDGNDGRQLLLAIMVGLWGTRLALYLAKRNIGHGEDWRYKAMRKKAGASFPLRSLVTVFGLQGALMWIVSLPVQFGNGDSTPGVGPIAVMGIMVWLVGFAFEVIGDAQLARFKKDPNNAGKVLDTGLWSLTRHPNYFGDALLWWGIGIVGAETGSGIIGFIGPVVMTFFLMRVSGVPMLERSLSKRREGYAEYIARTSSFVPRPPKKI